MFDRLRVMNIAFGAVVQMVVMASSQLKTVLRLMMTGHLLWLYNPPWLAYSFYLCVRYCPSHIYRISIWLRPEVLFSITPSKKYHSISHMNYLFRWLCWSPSYLPSICICTLLWWSKLGSLICLTPQSFENWALSAALFFNLLFCIIYSVISKRVLSIIITWFIYLNVPCSMRSKQWLAMIDMHVVLISDDVLPMTAAGQL